MSKSGRSDLRFTSRFAGQLLQAFWFRLGPESLWAGLLTFEELPGCRWEYHLGYVHYVGSQWNNVRIVSYVAMLKAIGSGHV